MARHCLAAAYRLTLAAVRHGKTACSVEAYPAILGMLVIDLVGSMDSDPDLVQLRHGKTSSVMRKD